MNMTDFIRALQDEGATRKRIAEALYDAAVDARECIEKLRRFEPVDSDAALEKINEATARYAHYEFD